MRANAAVVINGGVTVTDVDNTTLATATVTLTNFVAGQDVLSFTPGRPTGTSRRERCRTGVLTLTSAGATATLAQWQAALDAVTYTNTATIRPRRPAPSRSW